jgi:hypothetical protein
MGGSIKERRMSYCDVKLVNGKAGLSFGCFSQFGWC